MQVKIIDSTLREGRQSLLFDNIFKMHYDYLSVIQKIGVFDVEYRNPSTNKKEFKEFKRLKNKFPKINFYAHIFLSKQNIDWVINEPSIENISTFVNLPLNNKTKSYLNFLTNKKNKNIRIGIEHITNTSVKDLNNFVNFLKNKKNVKIIGFSDTLGNFSPEKLNDFIKKITIIDFGKKSVEFHLHNDCGLAAANASQILLKANKKFKKIYFSTSICGIGERNGILSYGDLFSNIIRLKIKSNFNFSKYGKLIKLTEKYKLVFNRDPISYNTFLHFASSHIIGELGEKKYTNISPEKLGMKSKFIFNEFTNKEVFDLIAKKCINQSILKKTKNKSTLKNYIIKRMKKENKNILCLNDLILYIKEFYKNKN
jgi:isopropylmalate/homocitrate/citramalate synthase